MTQEEAFWEELGEYSAQIINALSGLSTRSFIGITNLQTRDSWWSDRAVEFFGLSQNVSRYGSERPKYRIHPEDLDRYRRSFYERVNGIHLEEPIEYRMDVGELGYRTFTAKCRRICDLDGRAVVLVVLIDDNGIEGTIDAVTGLHNGKAFTKRVREIAAFEETVAILKIGLNKFSNTNIMYGTEFADAVLKRVSDVLVATVGQKRESYRLAGAKFACILPALEREELYAIYDRLQHAIAEEIVINGKKVPFGISGGALYPGGRHWDGNAMRSRLTYALNHSKHKHHGELVIFNDDICHDGSDNLRLIGEVHRSAVEGDGHFFLAYQPIAEQQSGRIVGAEALLRWKKDPYGIVPPGVFIEWLEEDPCFFELGNWIIRQAVRDAKEIRKEIPEFLVNVNITAVQLERPEFKDTVLQILQEEQMPAQYFCMELTERCREMDLRELREQIVFFQEKGIRIALDDFGTGNASLSAALELPFDELKIDMSFVKGAEQNPVKQALIRSIVDFAKELGHMVCIEGVENRQVYDFLKRYDASLLQGYYYARPLPFPDFREYMSRQPITLA